LNNNTILQGNNFGFRTGKSIADVIDILRIRIDDAKTYNKQLIVANLDIKKAYESVPWEAMETTLRRIKIPDEFINFLKRLDNNKSKHSIR